jgi:hypothetical protein
MVDTARFNQIMGVFINRGNRMYFIAFGDQGLNKVHSKIIDVPGGI